MFKRLLLFLKAPVYEDEHKTRIARLLNTILLSIIGLLTAFWSIRLLTDYSQVTDSNMLVLVGLDILMIALLAIMRRGYVQPTIYILIIAGWMGVTVMAWQADGVKDSVMLVYTIIILLASLLSGWRLALAFVGLIIVTGWGLAYAELLGHIVPSTTDPTALMIDYTFIFALTGVLIYLLAHNLYRALDETNMSNRSLKLLNEEIEVRVAERTRDLALAVEIGRSLARVHDLNALLQEAAELIYDRFNLYHVQIYLADSAQKTLILRAGTGQAASQLLSRRHSLAIAADSINGSAALNKKSVIVTDTRTNPLFRPNPLLPETRAEMAVPLLIGDRVLGVLDLQSTASNNLTEEALLAFATVSSQLAIAIDNANLFTVASQARTEAESYLQRLTRTGWADYLDAINREEKLAYVYDATTDTATLSPGVVPISADRNALQLPITVANEPIGIIQVEVDDDRHWTEDTISIVATVAQQVAQQVENLRLLEEAQRYRAEAETAVRRMAHEGWQAYTQDKTEIAMGYLYDQNQVRPLSPDTPGSDVPTLEQALQVRGETIGSLALHGVDPTPETVELLQLVSARLSDHLENLRLSAQTEQSLAETADQARRLALLNEASSRLVTAMEESEIIQVAVTYALRLFDAPGTTLALLNPATQMLEVYGSGDTPDHVILMQTMPATLEGTTTTTAMRGGELVYIPDLRQDHHSESAQLAAMGLRAILSAPLLTRRGAIGTLNIASPEVHAFGKARLQNLIIQFAALLAATIDERRLLTAAQSQAEKERVVNAISQRIQSTLTMEEALQTAVTELGQALQTRYTQIAINPTQTNGRNEVLQEST